LVWASWQLKGNLGRIVVAKNNEINEALSGFLRSEHAGNKAAQFLLGKLLGQTTDHKLGDPSRMVVNTFDDFEACKRLVELPFFNGAVERFSTFGEHWMVIGNWWDDLCKVYELEKSDRGNNRGITEASIEAAVLTDRRQLIKRSAIDELLYSLIAEQFPEYSGKDWVIGLHTSQFSYTSMGEEERTEYADFPKDYIGFCLCKFGEKRVFVMVKKRPLNQKMLNEIIKDLDDCD
jgi:hypothetical protein